MLQFIWLYQLATFMQTTTIKALDARQRLGELLELVYYKGEQFRIVRKDKPMARLIGEPFIAAIEKVLKHNPRLAETIEIMLDEEAMQAIKKGTQEIREGKIIPLEEVLND